MTDRLVRFPHAIDQRYPWSCRRVRVIVARGVDKIESLLAPLANDESLPALARSLFAHLGAQT